MKIKATPNTIELLCKLNKHRLSFSIYNPEKKNKPIYKLLEKTLIFESSSIEEFFKTIRVILNSNIRRCFCYKINFYYGDKYWEYPHCFFSKTDKRIWILEFDEVLSKIYAFVQQEEQ